MNIFESWSELFAHPDLRPFLHQLDESARGILSLVSLPPPRTATGALSPSTYECNHANDPRRHGDFTFHTINNTASGGTLMETTQWPNL